MWTCRNYDTSAVCIHIAANVVVTSPVMTRLSHHNFIMELCQFGGRIPTMRKVKERSGGQFIDFILKLHDLHAVKHLLDRCDF